MSGWFEDSAGFLGDLFAFVGSVLAFVFLMVVAVGMLVIFSWPWFIAMTVIAFAVLRLGATRKTT